MKILVNNYTNSTQNDSKQPQTNPYPRELTCEYCSSTLEYDEADVQVGFLGLAYVCCPLCKQENAIEDNEKTIDLTPENIEFPTHFWHTSTEIGAIDCCDNKTIRNYIKDGVDYFRKNKDEYSWCRSTGNLYLNVHRYDDDEQYEVTISNDFYSTYIPFQKEDYKEM